MRLQTVIEGYWLAREREFSASTVRDYQLTFRRLVDHLGADREFAAITSDDIHGFLNLYRKGRNLSAKSLANMWIALSSLWTWAELELRCDHIIRQRVPRPRFHRAVIEPYTEVEIKAMLGVCERTAHLGPDLMEGRQPGERPGRFDGVRNRAILVALVDSGVRASELCNLRLNDYEPKTGRLHVRQGKGNKDRFTYLGTAARRTLWRYLSTRMDPSPHAPLFATRNETALDRDGVRHLVQRIAARAGVSHATTHRFRHTFAINFLRNGGNLLELQRLLGHERMDTLHIYVQLAQADLSDAHRIASPADRWHL